MIIFKYKLIFSEYMCIFYKYQHCTASGENKILLSTIRLTLYRSKYIIKQFLRTLEKNFLNTCSIELVTTSRGICEKNNDEE